MSTKRLLMLFLFLSLTVLTGLGVLAAAGPVGESATTAVSQGAIPDWSGESNQAGAQYGESVRSAGDVNGDGYDDAIVGAWQYNNGDVDNSGRAYLYYGSATGLSLTPDWEAPPPVLNASGFFGGMAASAGDVNGDDYDDIMISMVNYDNAASDEGAVFVWYGSDTGLSANYDWMARGDNVWAHFGWGLGTAGDVNDDGYDDIIAGALRYDGGTISHAYVWHGSPNGLDPDGSRPVGLPSNADWTATTDQHCNVACSDFGTRVGTAGDVNGDGYTMYSWALRATIMAKQMKAWYLSGMGASTVLGITVQLQMPTGRPNQTRPMPDSPVNLKVIGPAARIRPAM